MTTKRKKESPKPAAQAPQIFSAEGDVRHENANASCSKQSLRARLRILLTVCGNHFRSCRPKINVNFRAKREQHDLRTSRSRAGG
jgi:hypothetical protein